MSTVLHLTESWGPGGAETVFLDVAEGIRDRGWRSLTAVQREGWVSRALADRGFDPWITGGAGSWDLSLIADLVRFIRREDVDLLHAHLFGSGLYGGVAARISGIPSVTTLHGRKDLQGLRGYRRVKLPLFDVVCDRKVFVSEPLRSLYRDRVGGSLRGAEVIHNGIDTERYRPTGNTAFRRELGIDPHEFLVGTVGNVRPAKNHALFLEAAGSLRDWMPDCHFVLVGQAVGPLFDRLSRRRQELGLEDTVHFVGFREDVARVLNSFDAYVLTSESEGFSLTTVQAMATRLPVVATRCGGPEVLIEDGETGFLVNRGDALAIASTLRRLRMDKDLTSRVGEAARDYVVGSFSVEAMVDAYECLYREVLEE